MWFESCDCKVALSIDRLRFRWRFRINFPRSYFTAIRLVLLLLAPEFLAIPGLRFWESCYSRFSAARLLSIILSNTSIWGQWTPMHQMLWSQDYKSLQDLQMLQSLRDEREGQLLMLLSPKKNSQNSLFKEVRVFKVLGGTKVGRFLRGSSSQG